MAKFRTLEFWLVALLVLLVVVTWLTGFQNFGLGKELILPIIIAWTILALAWIFREIVRWFRSWGEEQ